MKNVHFIVGGLILLVTCFTSFATAQTGPAGKQIPAELTAAIFGDSRPLPQRPIPQRSAASVRQQPFSPASQVRESNNLQKKEPAARKPAARIVGVTTLAPVTQPKLTAGQQSAFRPFQLGTGQPVSKVGVSRFSNSGMRPSESGGLPVTPRVVPTHTQDQRAILLERAVRERADRESLSGESSYSANSYDANYGGELAEDQPPGQPGGEAGQGSGDFNQNPASARPVVSTALPENFVANRLARPTTGISRFSGPLSVRGPASPRRAAGIPSSPMILPAGAGRRSSAGRRGGGCGG